jgi:CRISPR-associated protein Cst1
LSGKIRFYLDDWLFNSGLVGFYNILKKSEDSVVVGKDYLEFEIEVLENFEEKYFNYFISTYEKNLTWYKIISFENTIKYYEEKQFEGFDDKALKTLNKYISDVAKKFIKSNSYLAAFEFLGTKEEMLSLEKQLTPLKVKKNQDLKDIIPDVRNTFDVLKEIINYLNRRDVKKYVAAKNVIYSIINKAWNGICFLNPQTKEKDMYKDYKEYFVKPAMDYFNEDKSKYKYDCFTCDEKIKDMTNDLGFLNAIGFDVKRKASHVWNFNNDISVCPLCKLIYSCVPAGFSYAIDSGIYVNDNFSMSNAIGINSKIKTEVLETTDTNRSLTYRALVESIKEQFTESTKYELADVQVVRYVNEKYRFNILTKNILELIYKCKTELNNLISSGYKEINTYFNIYDIVLDSLFNSQNLYLLMHKMLLYKLTDYNNCYFYGKQINSVMKINYNFMRRLGYMEKVKNYIVDKGRDEGKNLRLGYGKNTDKLSGISYRLLNALKVNDVDMFMDTVLNCYLYVKKSVPPILLEVLKDEDAFKTVGYAFTSGLIEGQDNIKNMEVGKDDK